MRKPRRALIVGGSMSGLFCALYLRRRGWQASVFERAPVALSGRGAGIMTHPQIRDALGELGLDATHDFGVAIGGRLTLNAAGRIIARRPCPQIATSWNRLFAMLREAVGGAHYHLRKDLRSLAETADGVTAHFADGSTASGDLLIGADGFRSSVRGQLLPETRPQYAGYVAWRGLAGEDVLANVLSPEEFNSLAFYLPPGEQVLGYPVAGPDNDLRPGHRSWNIVWYRPADETTEMPRLLTDEAGQTHELSIPPPLIARRVVNDMRAAAERLLPPQFRAVMRLIEQPFLQPIYDLASARMAFGRVALAGDAAFVIRPHVGGGIVKAAEDAAVLAEALDGHEDVAQALRAYEAERIGVGERYIEQARRLGSYLRTSFESEEAREEAARLAEPERVMSETAMLDFLRG
jgi:2-polyprenyl-6-methoxyphenol hydroxylase-like FAD-dependent oxidoreductase